MKRTSASVLLFVLLSGICAAAPDGYVRIESAAASVNGEVIFHSDVVREACFYRCGAVPGQAPREIPLSEARERIISDTLVLQESKKLGLGTADNAALASESAQTLSRLAGCDSPCAASVAETDAREMVRRRLLVGDFLERRVAVYIEVNDEEVRREIVRRTRSGAPAEQRSEEAVRKSLYAEKAAAAIRTWFARTTSKSQVVRSPLSEP